MVRWHYSLIRLLVTKVWFLVRPETKWVMTRAVYCSWTILMIKVHYLLSLNVNKQSVSKPILMCTAKTWILCKKKEKKLNSFEKSFIKDVWVNISEENTWRMKCNWEVRELCRMPVIEVNVKAGDWGGVPYIHAVLSECKKKTFEKHLGRSSSRKKTSRLSSVELIKDHLKKRHLRGYWSRC